MEERGITAYCLGNGAHEVKSICNTVSIGILLADTPNTERKAA